MRRTAIILAMSASMLLGGPYQAAAQTPVDGAAVYKRCAACHLPTGAGVPGAYPPLGADVRALAGSSAGRRYLILVVTRGVSGPLIVEGKTYRGVMPAQAGLNDAQVAAVLNHITKGSSASSFSAGEIAQQRASGSATSPAAVAKVHPGTAGK